MSGSSTCKYCNRPIVWTVSKRGKSVPLDPTPGTSAAFDFAFDSATEHGRIVFGLRKAKPDDARRYRSHFVSCPRAARAAKEQEL